MPPDKPLDNPAVNFVEFMTGVGDSAVNVAKEGAYGVYDFGRVAVGGAKILTKEGLSAAGLEEAAAKIAIEDIEPLSALGKVASSGGYAGLGNAVKDIPANTVNALGSAAEAGDMRAFGTAVTDAVLLAEGARAGVSAAAKGAASGAGKVKAAVKPPAKPAAAAVPEVAPAAPAAPAAPPAPPAPKAAAKAKAARKKAADAQNAETSNKACPSCDKQNDQAARAQKQEQAKAADKDGASGAADDFSYVVKELPDDLVPDASGVYGHMPLPGTPFAKPKWSVDWTNPAEVAAARKVRLDYHKGLAEEKAFVDRMRSQGVPGETIARELVDMRNKGRMAMYPPEQLPMLFERNMGKYQNKYGPGYDDLLEKYGSVDGIIAAGTRSNPSMDILTGIGKME